MENVFLMIKYIFILGFISLIQLFSSFKQEVIFLDSSAFFFSFFLSPGLKKCINIIAVQSEMHKCLWYLNRLSHSIGFSFQTQLSTSLFFISQSTRGALEGRISRSMFPVYTNATLNPNSI